MHSIVLIGPHKIVSLPGRTSAAEIDLFQGMIDLRTLCQIDGLQLRSELPAAYPNLVFSGRTALKALENPAIRKMKTQR